MPDRRSCAGPRCVCRPGRPFVRPRRGRSRGRSVDEIGPAVFVDVADEDRHAGMLEREFRVQSPLAFERIGRRSSQPVGMIKSLAVAVHVAEAQPVAAAADADHVLVELAVPCPTHRARGGRRPRCRPRWARSPRGRRHRRPRSGSSRSSRGSSITCARPLARRSLAPGRILAPEASCRAIRR